MECAYLSKFAALRPVGASAGDACYPIRGTAATPSGGSRPPYPHASSHLIGAPQRPEIAGDVAITAFFRATCRECSQSSLPGILYAFWKRRSRPASPRGNAPMVSYCRPLCPRAPYGLDAGCASGRASSVARFAVCCGTSTRRSEPGIKNFAVAVHTQYVSTGRRVWTCCSVGDATTFFCWGCRSRAGSFDSIIREGAQLCRGHCHRSTGGRVLADPRRAAGRESLAT
jgi:hypothetical protein